MVSDERRSRGRETRLLLVTIAVSVAALLLLARFRFPERTAQPSVPVPAPLERLAARAAYDELASAMADLERRLAPRLLLYRVSPARPEGAFVVAPRITGSRAIAVVGPDEQLESVTTAVNPVTHDTERGLAVLMIASGDDAIVTPRTGSPRPGPRYVVVVEGTANGPTFRPVYVARTSADENPGGPLTEVTINAVQAQIPRGAAVFGLDGSFIGLVKASGPVTTLYAADALQSLAAAAQPSAPPGRGDLGVDVQAADAAILRAAGTDRGVVVTHVRAGGPAVDRLRPADVIRAVDDLQVDSVEAFRRAERTRTPGAPMTVTFVRFGTEQRVTYRAADAAAGPASQGLGITGRNIPDVGVEVVAVVSDGAGATAGVHRGDLLLTLNGQPLAGVNGLETAFSRAKPGETLLLGISRGERHLVVAMEKR